MKNTRSSGNSSASRLDDKGCFVIDQYNYSKPFSNFFPGVAGCWGIPMWVFYVNRGQCVTSFGIESKDKAILEFKPANKAYRTTSLQGFRTFLKVTSGGRTRYWEPFRLSTNDPYQTRHSMSITSHDLTIEEANDTLGISVRVNYFTLPDEAFPALVRRVTIENKSKSKTTVEMIDGLPVILAYGQKDWVLKNMSRTVEAWVKVGNMENKAPFYHLNVEVADTPRVEHIEEGNFYFSFISGSKEPALLDPLVEAEKVFGASTDFIVPQCFLESKTFRLPERQETSNRTPCAMSHIRFPLSSGKSKEIVSLVGHTHSVKDLDGIVGKVCADGYIDRKAAENEALIERVKQMALTHSFSEPFNLYSGQTFLDNVLRGGLPISLETGHGRTVFNVYSRKHGDLERDYNFFWLAPTHFSQGNGNYRDVNQNRRNDVWFNPDVRDNAIVNFLSLSQADGYNPLVVKGMSFSVKDSQALEGLVIKYVRAGAQLVRKQLQKGFQPGELLALVMNTGVKLKVKPRQFLQEVLSVCHKHELADHGEGFWVDHWTYNLDLIESYLSVYPEDLFPLLCERPAFTFYLNSHYVLPREDRFLLSEQGVRQYQSVAHDPQLIRAAEKGHVLRTEGGTGKVYHTTLLVKLLCLAANKAATFDPKGCGIEMEADKPGWYDALNGLPGLLGSSLCETFELKRLCDFLIESLARLDLPSETEFPVFEELADFIDGLSGLLVEEKDPAAYWHQSNDLKEKYRKRVRSGISGRERALDLPSVTRFLQRVIKKADTGIRHATDKKGQVPTYFYYEVTDYAQLDKQHQGCPHVLPVRFKQHTLPLFLEGFVHAFRVQKSVDDARRLYQIVKKSPLFDKKLRMYKVNADLTKESEEIGRTRIFPRGWLENESVWLHMEYKYLLELLRNGLAEEYDETLRDILVPFLPPEQYGRSTLENSSFIVSSAHCDEALHGQGFVARLSGSTAEFMHMWLWMNAGKNPFVLDARGQVCLTFQPVLAEWLFTRKASSVRWAGEDGTAEEIELPPDTYAFSFLDATLVVYHNPKRKNTFGKDPARARTIRLQYRRKSQPLVLEGDIIPAPYAREVREQKVRRIDVEFE